MADFGKRIAVELDNMEQVLSKFPESSQLPNLSELEIAGVAAFVHPNIFVDRV